MNRIRSLFFQGKQHRDIFSLERSGFIAARTLIQVFYVFVLYYALTRLPAWHQFQNFDNLKPLWPVYWIHWVDPHWAARGIMVFAFFGSLAGAFFNSYRWVRIVVFLSFLEFLAFKYSFGKIGHSTHLMLIMSFIFIFLPKGWSNAYPLFRATRQTTLHLFWGAQAFILMTYTLAGIGKIGGAIYQLYLGEMHAFHPDALAYHIAERLLQTGSSSFLGALFIENPWVAFPAMLVMLYAQVFSIWVAFRPCLHRVWGALLVLFHVNVSLTLSINFHPQVFLISIFFLCSPFYYSVPFRDLCAALPVVGLPFRRRA